MVELEYDSHTSDDVGEPSALAEKSAWDKNFVSVHARKLWDSISQKWVIPQLLERPLNLDATKKTCQNIVTEI